jgi:hypothetical protein
MNVWLWGVNKIVDELEDDMDRLHHCNIEDSVMFAFRMNPKSCGDYRGCTYHDFCMTWTNPLQRCAVPPLGYKEEFWNPEEAETKIKQELEFPR